MIQYKLQKPKNELPMLSNQIYSVHVEKVDLLLITRKRKENILHALQEYVKLDWYKTKEKYHKALSNAQSNKFGCLWFHLVC